MIEIVDKSECCGCEACNNICPKRCIKMQEDEEGFRYPIIDKENCINCNVCETVCPWKNEAGNKYLNEIEFYAGYNKDDVILRQSSSGGIFMLLCENIIKENGVVFGVQQKQIYDVSFSKSETLEECGKFMGSKYLQAEVNFIYETVKEDLDKEKKVLFSGTPCQVAGLYKYLKKTYCNLYTCDVVCHGVPSNKVYRKYIEYMERNERKEISGIKWRDKVKGWGPNRVTLYFRDGTYMTTISRENMFQKGFLDNLYLRQSCYKCKYAKLPRIADVSLSDFWGYDGQLKEKNNNRGLSAIIVSTTKGKELFEGIKNNLEYHAVYEEYLTSRSRHVHKPPLKNKKREVLFRDIDRILFIKLAKKYKMKSSKVKIIIGKIKLRIKKIGG